MRRGHLALFSCIIAFGCGATYEHNVNIKGLDKPSENIAQGAKDFGHGFDPARIDDRVKTERENVELKAALEKQAPPLRLPPPEKITGAKFNIGIYDDDKECGELVLILYQGPAEVGRWGYGRGEDWDDPGSRSFNVQNLNIELNNQPLSM